MFQSMPTLWQVKYFLCIFISGTTELFFCKKVDHGRTTFQYEIPNEEYLQANDGTA